MKINIVSIFTQKIGRENHFWGIDENGHIYLLNNYSLLSDLLKSISDFKQDPDQLLRSIRLNQDQIINIPRKEISRLTCSTYHIN